MAQMLCVILDESDTARLSAIFDDRSRPLKHVQRARIAILPLEAALCEVDIGLNS